MLALSSTIRCEFGSVAVIGIDHQQCIAAEGVFLETRRSVLANYDDPKSEP